MEGDGQPGFSEPAAAGGFAEGGTASARDAVQRDLNHASRTRAGAARITAMTRREFLALAAAMPAAGAAFPVSPDDDRFLEDVSRRAFLYFLEQWNPKTGLFRDRAHADGTVVQRPDG